MAQIKFDRRKGATQDLENLLTPSEIAEILKGEDGGRLPFLLRPLLASGDAPVGYERKSWSESASFHTANRGARSLIATFCGTSKGVGLPIAYFLQMLRDDLYDVVVLYDRRKLHFDRGVEGFSESFLETARRIEAFARAKGYDEIITFGASLGGYPALRAGLLLGARRAISMGRVWLAGGTLGEERTHRGGFRSSVPLLRRSASGVGRGGPGPESKRCERPGDIEADFPEMPRGDG